MDVNEKEFEHMGWIHLALKEVGGTLSNNVK
jgi:hypothetical protein